ncbi:MAG: imidazole glycerol phosphate synthase subunit HisH [Bacteroidetes bacterium]|nr:imidazole glycerol phosphate synthase subunit HisH [Bacteroidota bacterium]
MSKKQKIVIIDYGVGNVHSVANAISFLGYSKLKISDKEIDINGADTLILPGVGAFDEAMRNLNKRNLHLILGENVLVKKKKILGICVGMQMLASYSEENGIHKGLDWIKGSVKKLEVSSPFSVPHVGWNDILIKKSAPLFDNCINMAHFYFDHSYHFETELSNIAAECDYGIKLTAAVQLENIFGVQFHPEKSQLNGLRMFRSFFNSI